MFEYDEDQGLFIVERTVTLTFDFNEGGSILNWVESNVSGTASATSMSIIEITDGMNEISRVNYFEVRPIKYEQHLRIWPQYETEGKGVDHIRVFAGRAMIREVIPEKHYHCIPNIAM